MVCNMPLPKKEGGEGAKYLTEVFGRMATSHADCQFIFVGQLPSPAMGSLPNITLVPASPRWPARWWHFLQFPKLMAKHRPDIFIDIGGIYRRETIMPQVAVFPPGTKAMALRQAAKLVVAGEEQILQLANTGPGLASNAVLTFFGLPENWQPLDDAGREEAKMTFGGGREYFFYGGGLGDEGSIIAVLKAFALFKKRQQSNLQLLLGDKKRAPSKALLEKLATYKYRAHILLQANMGEASYSHALSGAYAFIYTLPATGHALPLQEAMRRGVPVVANATLVSNIAGEAALYVNEQQPEEIARHMMTLYKDENLRSRLIQQGFIQSQPYQWQNAADMVWKCIKDLVNQS